MGYDKNKDNTLNYIKVLLIGPEPPPMGGLAQYCIDLLNSDLSNRITFFPITIPANFRPQAYTNIRTWNIFKRDGLFNILRQFLWAYKRMNQFRMKIQKEPFDIIHITSCTGWGFWRNGLHIYYGKKLGLKVVFHILGAIDDFWRNGSFIRRFFIRIVLDMADIHIVQSDGLQSVTSNFTNKPVFSIYNGVNTNRYIPKSLYSNINKNSNKIRVITVGVLGHRKGHYDLIEIAKKIKVEGLNIKIILVGGGEIDVFKSIIDNEGLEDFIELTGGISNLKKIELLQNSDIFVLPTYAEGQPIALLEAMSVGLPIISTMVGSIPEVIKQENGFLIEPGHLTALYEKIKILAASPGLRQSMGLKNRQESVRKYSFNRTVREISDIYRTLI